MVKGTREHGEPVHYVQGNQLSKFSSVQSPLINETELSNCWCEHVQKLHEVKHGACDQITTENG